MKKIMLFASALAGLFFAASCQQENLEPVMSGNTVTYTIKVPETVATKALGDNIDAVTELHYEVYRTAGERVTYFTGEDHLLYHETATLRNGEATINLELINDQNFTILFWAQVPENGIYDPTDLTKVSVMQEATANQEKYAAFSNVDHIVWGDDNLVGREVELKRAISQLNIATTPASLTGVNDRFNNAITLKTSNVTVTGLSTSFDVANQEAGEISNAAFVFADYAVPTNPETLNPETLEVNDDEYVYVAMNYVGFAKKAGSTVKVAYEFTTSEGTIDNVIDNVPVKANYRTNIIGNLVTVNSDYTITLDQNWVSDPAYNVEVVSVATAQELQDAIDAIETNETGNIKLEGDIELGALASLLSVKSGENPYGLLIPASKTIILDLNGCTLKQEVECKASYSMIKNQGNLTITGNGTISFKDLSTGGGSEWGSYIIDNTGYLTVENGTIVHLGSTNFEDRSTNLPIQNYAGKVVINGGIISSPSFRSLRDFTAGGEIIINGGQFLGQVWMQGLGAGSSSLTINGGEFNPTAGYDGSSVYITNGTNDVQVSITGGTFNTKIGCADSNKSGVKGCITGGLFKADPSAFVADDYVAVYDENAKVWNIAEAYAKVGETKYTSLNDAVTEALKLENVSIVVLRDTEMGAVTVPNGKTITIDLNGKTITGVDTATGSYGLITNKANLTVKGPGAIELSATNDRDWNAYSSVISNTVGGNLIVEGGAVLEHLGGTDMAYGIDNLTNGKGTSAVTTIKDATVISTYRAVRQFLNGIEATNELYVEEGAVITGANKSIWMQDPSAKLNTGKLVVEEGAELNGDVYLFVTAGSEAWPVEVSIADSALAGESTVMTGNVPAGYTVENVDGIWMVIAWENIDNTTDLQKALAAGKNVVLANDLTITPEEMTTAPYGNKMALSHKGGVFNGNGNALSVTANGDNYVVMTNGGTIKNLDINRGFRGIVLMYPNQDVYVDNVNIGVNDEVGYTINTAEGDGTHSLYVSNSVLNGWCSIGTAVKDVTFTNCTFGQGTYYTNVYGRLVKPYVDAIFDGCDFCSMGYLDLSAFVGTKVTLKNCTVNGVKLTDQNWTSLVAPESTCGEGQISIELKNGTYMTADNVADYIVFE